MIKKNWRGEKMIALAILFTFVVGALSIASLAVNGLAFLSREELKEIQKKNELEQEKGIIFLKQTFTKPIFTRK